ncbi:MAG: DUF4124 domain-containing protein [Hydrogenophaga sp.]|nr:DUF4124 domain-containing protein [Hydrogenophaga sp.]
MGVARWVHLLLAMALATGASGALSEVYRWKDSNGQVHFGDRPDAAESQGAKKLVVPRPNLAKGLERTPPTAPVGSTTNESGGETPKSAVLPDAAEKPAPGPAPKRGFAAQRQDSCQAKWAAFWASAECFGSCGRTTGRYGIRNNAGCEHCVETSRPGC